MSAETRPAAAAETAPIPEAADGQPAPVTDLEGLKQLQAEIEAKQRAERSIDREAMKRAEALIEARRQRAAAAPPPRPQPEGQPEKPQTIREYLDNMPIKAANARLIELCQRHGISLDSPWPPQFPKEDEPMQKPEPPQAEHKGQLVLFPQWGTDRRAAANAIFRSALFPALNNKQQRRYYPAQERLCSVEGVDVLFMGTQFDQSDLDVYLELLQIAHETPFGMECCFTAYSLLRALGRKTGKADYEQLHSEIIRLRTGTVDMTDHGIRYFGGLIEGGIRDETTKYYAISINPRFARLFKAGLWSSLTIEQRRALGRNQTAKALHAYYATHAAPGPHTYEKLADIIGLTGKNRRDVKATIIKAHEAMKRVGFMPDYEAGPKTIKAAINHTPGQTQHIVKKIIGSRKAKKGTG